MNIQQTQAVRIDKWLWAVRIYKTRSLATTACNNNQVQIQGVSVKPSRIVHIGDEIMVSKPPMKRLYKVLGILEQRQSAKVVVDYVADITPEEEIEKMRLMRLQKTVFREKGLGRPTKKERRELDDFGYL